MSNVAGDQIGAGAHALRPLPPAVGLDQLLRLHGEQFLISAYAVLLLRKPDKFGIAGYLPKLLNGTPKIQILREISESKESRQLGVWVPGMRKAVLLYRLGGLPLAGWIFRRAFGVEGSSECETKLRAAEEALHQGMGGDDPSQDCTPSKPEAH
jgi:hypothetical protein